MILAVRIYSIYSVLIRMLQAILIRVYMLQGQTFCAHANDRAVVAFLDGLSIRGQRINSGLNAAAKKQERRTCAFYRFSVRKGKRDQETLINEHIADSILPDDT